jgi:DNA-binding transcriptional ArsR family regulator
MPVVVKPSPACELVWAMSLNTPEAEAPYPARAALFAGHEDLRDRVRRFWDDGQGFFTEVLVLADRAGALFEEDPARLFELLESEAATSQRHEPLGSEPAEDQKRFRARLRRLRDKAQLRREWMELLRSVWDVIAPTWQARGRTVVEAQVRELRQKLPHGITYVEMESMFQSDWDGVLPTVFKEVAASGGEVLLAPSYFGRKGMFIAFPGRMLVSPPTPAVPTGPTAETRGRAKRFKALGDPTRLALLEAIGRRPRTVGELADLTGLAQPTVSNHVRVLRDAGLVSGSKDGGRRLEPDIAALERLFKEASGVVAGEA